MAVLMLLEWDGVPLETYERINEIVGIRGDADAPEGLIEHVAALDDVGLVICDVWESDEALGRFVHDRLGPALEQLGLPQEQPELRQVHNREAGTADDANFLVLVDVPDFDVDTYDEMRKQMPSHVNSSHPGVVHTAARGADGGVFVADLWSSPEAFGQFAQDEIGPAAQSAGLGEFQPRMLSVKNRIRGKAAQPA